MEIYRDFEFFQINALFPAPTALYFCPVELFFRTNLSCETAVYSTGGG